MFHRFILGYYSENKFYKVIWGLSEQTKIHGDGASSNKHVCTSSIFIDEQIKYRKLLKVFKETITMIYTCVDRASEMHHRLYQDMWILVQLSLHFPTMQKIKY